MMPGIYLAIIIIAGILLLGAISVSTTTSRPKRKGGSSLNKAVVAERWKLIEASAAAGASGLKVALGDADKLFDYTMKQLGYPGDTMADRLKIAQQKLSNRDAVWRAHKLRNSMAHDIEFDLVGSQVREALHSFERGLRDLGAL